MMAMPPHAAAHGDGGHNHAGNLHNFYHATMHVALLLACAAEAAERRWGAHGSVTSATMTATTARRGASSSLLPRVLVPRGAGLVALAYALWLLIALFVIHTLLQEPTEALRHHLLVAPLSLAAAAASADALSPRPAWLLARAFGLALTGAWMLHMALSREYGWAAAYEASPVAAQTVAALHFAWVALATATAAALAAALAPRGGALRGGSGGGGSARSSKEDDIDGHNGNGGGDDDDDDDDSGVGEGEAVLPYERELRRVAA
jgi:hypothetical protein